MPEIRVFRALQHRQWSDEKGAYVALKCAKCDRCKRPHARVYEIEVDGRQMRVGPNCLLKILLELPVEDKTRNTALKAAPKRAWGAEDDQAMGFWEEELGLAARVGRGLRKIFGG